MRDAWLLLAWLLLLLELQPVVAIAPLHTLHLGFNVGYGILNGSPLKTHAHATVSACADSAEDMKAANPTFLQSYHRAAKRLV